MFSTAACTRRTFTENSHRLSICFVSIAIHWFNYVYFLSSPSFGQSILGDPSVQVEEVESSTRQQLAQLDALLKGGEYSDAIELAQRLEDSSGDRLIEFPARLANQSFPLVRYVPFRDYLSVERNSWNRRFPEAWKQYSELIRADLNTKIDAFREAPLREERLAWFTRASASEQAATYWVARGDRYLEKGWLQAARWCFQNAHPTLRAPIGDPQSSGTQAVSSQNFRTGSIAWHFVLRHWKPSDQENGAHFRDWFHGQTEQSTPSITRNMLAGLWARLCWCSLLENDTQRAALERSMLAQLYSDQFVVDGKEETWLQRVDAWAGQSKQWNASPTTRRSSTTFAETSDRLNQPNAVELTSFERPRWQQTLPRHMGSHDVTLSKLRVAESSQGLLSYHPVVYEGRVYINLMNRLMAFDLASGHSWPSPKTPLPLFDTEIPDESLVPAGYPVTGSPRGTLTIADDVLYARLGSPVTAWKSRNGIGTNSTSMIVALDLNTEGRLLPGFPLRLSGEAWEGCEFEGSPLVVGDDLYVSVTQRNSVHLRRTVACFDRHRGTLRWHSPVIATAIPEGVEEANLISHQLLSYKDGRLFVVTGLGAVASIHSMDGSIAWLVKYQRLDTRTEAYPRSQSFRFRDLNPPVVDGDRVICAPNDCREIFSLDWGTGDLNWATEPESADDSVHLLGVHHDQLVTSGKRLHWFDVFSGKRVQSSNMDLEPGMGRGAIAGEQVYFPVSGKIFVFSLPQSFKPLGPLAEPIRSIDVGIRGSEGAIYWWQAAIGFYRLRIACL